MHDLPGVKACAFENAEDGWRCVDCGRRIRSKANKPPLAVCKPRGLGDMVADGLATVGITKERAQAVASAVGVADCGCSQRQAALNAIGREWLGIGLDAPATLTGERDTPDAEEAATAEGQNAESG